MIRWEHYTVQSWSNDHIQSGLKALIRGGGDSSWIEPAQKWFYWATDWWSRTKTLWRTTHTTTIWPVLYFQFSHHIIKYSWYLQIIYEAEPKRFHKADWQPSLGHLVRLTQGHWGNKSLKNGNIAEVIWDFSSRCENERWYHQWSKWGGRNMR